MASEILTIASVPGHSGAGYMDYGRLSRAEIIRRAKEVAAHEKKKWEMVLSTPDCEFDVRVVRGAHKQQLQDIIFSDEQLARNALVSEAAEGGK